MSEKWTREGYFVSRKNEQCIALHKEWSGVDVNALMHSIDALIADANYGAAIRPFAKAADKAIKPCAVTTKEKPNGSAIQRRAAMNETKPCDEWKSETCGTCEYRVSEECRIGPRQHIGDDEHWDDGVQMMWKTEDYWDYPEAKDSAPACAQWRRSTTSSPEASPSPASSGPQGT